MHSAEAVVTVGTVARNDATQATPRGSRPAAFGQRQWPVVAVLAACAVVIAVASSTGRGQSVALAVVIALVAGAPAAALRRWPVPVLAAATAANAVASAVTARSVPLPFGVMLGLASYLVASRLPRRVSIPAVAASAAAIGVALGYALLAARGAQVAAEAVESVAPLAAAWFIGDSVAVRRRYMAGLAEQAERERAAEAERARQHVREERVRIARELHDVVAHTLAVITVQAGVGRRLMAKRPEEAGTALESIEAIGRTAQEELQVVLGLLRDEEAGTAALAPAPKLVDIKELAETVRASGTPVDLRMSGIDRPLSAALELSVYRVVQEALTNVVKHAPGARAAVDLAVGGREIHIDVVDDGGGAASLPGGGIGQPGPGTGPAPGDLRQPPAPAPGPGPALTLTPTPGAGRGHGIVGMRERIAAFGGRLVAEPLPGRGFRVTAQVPIESAM
jgi:signal transduction histidine kinase